MAYSRPLCCWIVWVFLAVSGWAGTSEAQDRRRLIRDVEIERTLRIFAEPIFEAARLDPKAVKIFLVEDSSVNAFVAGGMNIFLHTGLLLASGEPGHVIGVIAHETGHIAGGHLVRVREGAAAASIQSVLAVVLGLGTAALTGNVQAGAGIILGGQQAAWRGFLRFSREQESFADLAAVRYVNGAGLSGRGLLSFLEELSRDDDPLAGRQGSRGYGGTHPLNQERLDHLRYQVEHASHYDTAFPAHFEVLHQRIRAKLLGFLEHQLVLDGGPVLDDLNLSSQTYTRAIAYHRYGDSQSALELLEGLIASEPDYPFFHELKGEILFKSGQAEAAVAPYRRASRLLPDNALLRILLAQALIEVGQDSMISEASDHLTIARRDEGESSWLWRLVARVWDRRRDWGMRSYALAEEALILGNRPLALVQSQRAIDRLPENSPSRLRALDIRYSITGE